MQKRMAISKLFDDVTKLIDDLIAIDAEIQKRAFISKRESKQFLEPISEKHPNFNKNDDNEPNFILSDSILKKKRKYLSKQTHKETISSPLKKVLSNETDSSSDVDLDEAVTPNCDSPVENPFVFLYERNEKNHTGLFNRQEEEKEVTIPLKMYSYFQIPIRENKLIVRNEQDLLTNSFISLHPAAYDNDYKVNRANSDPMFHLLYSRDKLICNIDKKQGYFIKYVNELLNSKSKRKNPNSGISNMKNLQVLDIYNVCYVDREASLNNNLKFLNYYKSRDVRHNPDGWRMLSCEFRMIYSSKIVRPLKPRSYLVKKNNEYKRIISPLVKEIIY